MSFKQFECLNPGCTIVGEKSSYKAGRFRKQKIEVRFWILSWSELRWYYAIERQTKILENLKKIWHTALLEVRLALLFVPAFEDLRALGELGLSSFRRS
jgi:hypothetical protein